MPPEAPDVLLTVREDSAHLMVNDYPVPADSALEPIIYAPLPCHDVLVFELPLAWTGKTAARLLVLPARGETLSSAWTLWWERSSNSFSAVGESGLFGRRGQLNAGLSSTGLFYLEGGLDVTFTSPDDDLEDMPFDEGVGARRFLIFLGDGILLSWSPTLVSAGRYTLSVVRAQFGTVRRTHALGAECWCVQLEGRGQTMTLP
ncbi:MAG: hypothetical protein HS113_14515 [Verrucomicrobiales bacterium]|nr:hypothetical protein [Verrucomicrobiales bacterium]